MTFLLLDSSGEWLATCAFIEDALAYFRQHLHAVRVVREDGEEMARRAPGHFFRAKYTPGMCTVPMGWGN